MSYENSHEARVKRNGIRVQKFLALRKRQNNQQKFKNHHFKNDPIRKFSHQIQPDGSLLVKIKRFSRPGFKMDYIFSENPIRYRCTRCLQYKDAQIDQ